MRPYLLGLGVALVLASSPALATEPGGPPPPSGTGWIVGGSLIAGGGVLDLALAPGCGLTHVAPAQQVPCALTSVLSGVALVGVGVPLLAIGVGKRAVWLEHVRVAPERSGMALGWGGSF